MAAAVETMLGNEDLQMGAVKLNANQTADNMAEDPIPHAKFFVNCYITMDLI